MITDPIESICACLMAFHEIAQDATSKKQANELFACALTSLCKVAKKKPNEIIKVLDKIKDRFYRETMQ